MKKTTLTIPLWDRYVHILVGGKEKSVIKFVQKKGLSKQIIRDIKVDKINNDVRAAAWFCQKHGAGVMWFPKKGPSHALRSHEITHIVDFLMKWIGATDEMEARAYTHEWITKEVNSILR